MEECVRHDDRSELQADTKLFERDRHRSKARAGLHDWKRELAAGEEAGFLSVYGNQIRFGKNLQQVLCLELLDDGAEINVRTKHEQVEDVVNGLGGGPV